MNDITVGAKQASAYAYDAYIYANDAADIVERPANKLKRDSETMEVSAYAREVAEVARKASQEVGKAREIAINAILDRKNYCCAMYKHCVPVVYTAEIEANLTLYNAIVRAYKLGRVALDAGNKVIEAVKGAADAD